MKLTFEISSVLFFYFVGLFLSMIGGVKGDKKERKKWGKW